MSRKRLKKLFNSLKKKSEQKLSRRIAFHWFSQETELITENIPQHLADKVFIDEENIYPYVDIGVQGILDDGTLLIFANVAGHFPRPWGINWQGREGPFIYIIGHQFLTKVGKV